MGTKIDRGEIIEWKKNGWSYRIKTVKQKKYITRRKGNQEKSLGPFDEKLWKLIESTAEDTMKNSLKQKKIQEYINLVKSILGEIRANEMSKNCSHIIDGYCYFWKYDMKPGFFNIVANYMENNYYKKIIKREKDPVWVFKAVSFYCQNCPVYERN
jgi:hypothetical protein